MYKNSAKRALTALCAASKRLTACIVAVLVAVFFIRVQAYAQTSRSARIFFPLDNSVVSENYLENLTTLAKIDYIAAFANSEDGFSVTVTSYSSPEGRFAYNKALSAKRAAALRDFIVERHPSLAGHITVLAGGEAWEDLRKAVENDFTLNADSRSRMLSIIDSDADPDLKEARLKALDCYAHAHKTYFRRLRYAEISLEGVNAQAETPEKVVAVAQSSESAAASGAGRMTFRNERNATTIYFPVGSTSIDTSYAGNKVLYSSIGKLLAGKNAEDYSSLSVTSGCSIDGPVALNSRISLERGKSLIDWIEENYPQYRGRVELNSRGEDWEALSEAIESDDKLASETKYRALAIIGSNDSAERKEARLRQLDSWDYIQSDILPQTRYAYISTRVVSISKPQNDTISKVESDTLAVADSTFAVDTLAYAREEIAGQADNDGEACSDSSAVSARKRVPVAAITTNLLYESATIFTGFHSTPLNVGLEVPVGKHWSVHANYLATAPWRAWNNNADCAELIHFDLGARWYPGGSFNRPFSAIAGREVLDGWYAYASAGAGYYDFEQNGKGYQGEEILGTIGFGYGLNLGHNWSLDFAIGAGPLYTQYRYYEARNNNQHLMYQYSGTMQYFGVTDAKVTLRYLFHWNKKVKTNNGDNK